MPRRSKKLNEYPSPPYDQVNEIEFDVASSLDRVNYTCTCERVINSQKRLIAARLLDGNPLLCPSCRNKRNNQ